MRRAKIRIQNAESRIQRPGAGSSVRGERLAAGGIGEDWGEEAERAAGMRIAGMASGRVEAELARTGLARVQELADAGKKRLFAKGLLDDRGSAFEHAAMRDHFAGVTRHKKHFQTGIG